MSKKQIVVIGKEGQLASELLQLSHMYDDYHFTFTSKDEINLIEKHFEGKIESLRPDIIINTAAYTQVDKAEDNIENATLLNTIAPGKIAKVCSLFSIPFIHISTDYVYNSNVGYPLSEGALTNPKSVYGITKLNGEKLVLDNSDKSIIIRTSWLYSSFGNNFVKTMLKLSKEKKSLNIVDDQFGSPTYVEDLAKVIIQVVEKAFSGKTLNYGVYNFANEGVTSWKEFAEEIFKLSNIEMNINGISTTVYNAPAPRPLWSVMSLAKIKKEFDLNIAHWKPALKNCLAKL